MALPTTTGIPKISDAINTLRVISQHGIIDETDLLEQCGYASLRHMYDSCMNLLDQQGYVAANIGWKRYMITDKGLAWIYYYDLLNKGSEEQKKIKPSAKEAQELIEAATEARKKRLGEKGE